VIVVGCLVSGFGGVLFSRRRQFRRGRKSSQLRQPHLTSSSDLQLSRPRAVVVDGTCSGAEGVATRAMAAEWIGGLVWHDGWPPGGARPSGGAGKALPS